MTEYEIGILSRGGQGGVTLGKVLAYAATYDGKYSSAIPKYGAERRGAPVVASVRIFDRPVKRHAQILQPIDILALDVSLVPRFYPSDYFNGQGSITLNSPEIPTEYYIYKPKSFGYVNVQNIAQNQGLVRSGTILTGIPALGSFIKTTRAITLESLHRAIDKVFPKGKYTDANHKAADIAYDETIVLSIDEFEKLKEAKTIVH
jgi:pyruvate ferredoxin oxidoreductase gamma subunit